MKIFREGWWAPIIFATLAVARSAPAIYLDDDQLISLRARVYSQAAIRTEGSYDNTIPSVQAGQLVQHRNFFNPELEAKLASYTTWMRDQRGFLPLIAPDGLDFRLAGWGFYDGLYDYGTQQFDQQRKTYKTIYTEATSIRELLHGGDERTNPRDVYGHQQRVNELYLSYTKGPLFVRFGKQAISWGESDTVAILDQNNPFDIAHGPPGIMEDLDEARIPLWTLRTSYSVFDNWGPLSSGFIEGYWVPGDLDNTTAPLPLITLSPYAPPGPEPAAQAGPALAGFQVGDFRKCGSPNQADRPLCVALMDHVPSHSMGNSRWGVRAQAVVARDYTVSAWIYTTFPNTGVPRLIGKSTSSTLPFGQNKLFLIEFVHQLVPVIGASATFFSEPLNGVIRMEVEYFNREPGFVPGQNLPQDPTLIGISGAHRCPDPVKGKPTSDCVPNGGSVPHADFIRWELGYDRFFFLRALNPTNSFTWVTAMVGSWNLNEGPGAKDFRQYGQQKPGTYPVLLPDGTYQSGTLQPKTDDFVQLQRVDAFWQTHLSTDYMHGRLSPSATVIVDVVGTWAAPLQLTYRWSDSLLFDLYYTPIGGMFSGLGFYRDRDQVAFRGTYQLN